MQSVLTQKRQKRTLLKSLVATVLACSLCMAYGAVYTPDNFASTGGTNLETYAMVKDSSGRVVIGGAFTTVQGQAGYQGLARFNADDSLDTSLKVATNLFVKTLAVQADGKILIGGAFTAVMPTGASTWTPFWGIARLNADGTLDASFQNAPAGRVKANGNVRSIAVQPDGKIVIVGYFNAIDGTPINRIARLNVNGTLDTSFNVGTGANDGVEDVKLQADGKIVIAGSFTQVQGTTIRGVARLNADGTLDTTFVPNANAPSAPNGSSGGLFPVYQIAIQADNKIVVNGGPLKFADEWHRGVVRLNANGTPDTAFNPFINDWGYSIALQTVGSEEKILAGGRFTVVGQRDVATDATVGTDVVRYGIARFNADGTVDADFDTSNGTNLPVWAVLPNSDGTVYLGGAFTSVAGMARNGIARLKELDPTTQVINFVQPDPAVYSAMNGATVTWTAAPPTSSSAGLPVTYSSLTASVCTVNASTGVVTLVTPAISGLCTIEANAAAGTQVIGGTTYNVKAAAPVQQSMQIDAPPDQSITFPVQTTPRNVTSGTFSIDPVATASSTLPVTYSSLTPSVCTVSGTTVTPVAGGLCTIAANQAGGTVGAVAFNAAPQVSQNVTVQSAQTISFPAQTAQSVVTGSSFNLAPVATATSGLAVTYTSLTPDICTMAGSAVRVLATGSCIIEANQLGNDYFTAATPVSQSVSVTALPAPAATPVPTLGEWGLIALSSLLGMFGLTRSRRRAS
ncbi:IPTL-CTERM sorting domain-containing protein [Diaphorobacter ruginosibacter]|uniref:IPTL-CTERM sorting domain-containing protein n=1 Tax=Diaphorobacter ruginosibacter TaxID=1715720 RepID=A0A7G9RJG3_9BURK|nr:IPTL-CTERM sorting domain-containing protein [Diaphorobacter ruginosibacter]QNN55738.1 IPTL-CTERM sorting domain-containing protein [Diaphorobacter ruginosibacter]